MGEAVTDFGGTDSAQNPGRIEIKVNPKTASRTGTKFATALDHAVLDALVSTAQDAIVLIDRHGRVLDWNQAAERLFGYSCDEVLGHDIDGLLAPARLQDEIGVAMQRFSQTGQGSALGRTLQLDAVHRDGTALEIELSLSSVEVAGRWFGLGVIRDTSDRKRLADTLARAERNFRSVVELNRSGILVLDRHGNICYANEAAQVLLGRGRDELISMPFGVPSGHLRAEMALRRRDGRPGTAEMSATETEWEGQPASLVMLHDVTELKEADANTRFLALHDLLTGLPNRRLFHERLEQALERALRSGERVVVFLMNLNRFTAINDDLGHEGGDAVLRAVGERLSGCLRASDTLACLGGDEFSAVVEGITHPADLDAVATKLEACLAQPLQVGETDFTVGASIGIAVYPDDGADADTLLRRADSALHAAKRVGSSHFRLFAASMEKGDGASRRLEQQLFRALERRELRLVYQPVARTSDGILVGMEALLRWHSPVFGDVVPDRFIPVLESSGRINEVGLWVVEQACKQLAAWRDAGVDPVSVSVNVSAVQLLDGCFPELVKEALQRFSIPARLLTVELTETAVVDDESVGIATLERLDRLGVWLHMDDFGTGWSSLGLLRKLPFDTVKIDRSFVADIADCEADALLVAGIISMGHSLNKAVIAEGVETEAQLTRLRDYRCDYAQGWLYSRPLNPPEIEQLLRERAPLVEG